MRKKMISKLPFTLIVFCILFNCQSIAIRDLPESEREKIMTKIYSANYDIVFNAVINVLEKNNFIIKNIEKNSGLIITDYKEGMWSAWGEAITGMATRGMVNARVIKISKNNTKVRLNLIHENRPFSSSVWTKAIYRTDSKKEWDEYFQKIEHEIAANKDLTGYENNVNSEVNKIDMRKESKTNNNDLEALELLINDDNGESIYLDISSIAKNKYLLVYQKDKLLFNLNEKYKLVRFKNSENERDGLSEIGRAKVIKIQNNKVVLIYTLFDVDIKLNKMDKLKYK